MAIEVLKRLPAPDRRPSSVRLRSVVDVERGIWHYEWDNVEVSPEATVEWEFDGLSAGDRPEIRLVGIEPFKGHPPVDLDPFFETVERTPTRIVGRIPREARGRYRYLVDVERAGEWIRLRCEPSGMGGLDLSGPPP
jgi:hypothetical protein